MTRNFVLVILLSAISIGSFYFAQRQSPVQELRVSPQIQDLGHVQQGQVLEFDASLTNYTNHEIELGTAIGSCRCTSIRQLAGSQLARGESVQVPVKWDISGKRGLVQADMVFDYYLATDKEARVTTSGSNRGQKKFGACRAVAFVEPEYFIKPEKLTFKAGSIGVSNLRLEGNKNSTLASVKTLRIVDFGASHDSIRIHREKSSQNGSEELVVTLDARELNSNSPQSNLINFMVEVVVSSVYEPIATVPIEIVTPTNSDMASSGVQ